MDFAQWKERLRKLDAACLCDADKSIRVMDPGLQPVLKGRKMIGIAHTVHCQRDFLSVVKALHDAKESEVLVIDGESEKIALAGELFASEAKRRGLAGMVIDGGYRDSRRLPEIAFPVYSRYITPMAGTAEKIFETQIPVDCGGVKVKPGDILFGGDDGIVVLDEDELAGVIEAAESIQRREEQVVNRLSEGTGFFDLLNFSAHYQKVAGNEESRLEFKLD